jgi:hypothetical protein
LLCGTRKADVSVPGEAAIGVGDGKFGVEPDRLGVVGDGAVVVVPGVPDVAAVVVGKAAIAGRLAGIVDDAGTARNRLIVAIPIIFVACAESRSGKQQQRSRNRSADRQTHEIPQAWTIDA